MMLDYDRYVARRLFIQIKIFLIYTSGVATHTYGMVTGLSGFLYLKRGDHVQKFS